MRIENLPINLYVSNLLNQSLVNVLTGSRQGTITLLDGRICEGAILHGKLNGKGIIKHPDGKIEEGDFVNNLLNGEGMITWPNTPHFLTRKLIPEKIHTGQFKDGLLHGKGSIIMLDGTTLTGQFENNMLNGYGIISLPNGGKYEGNFKDDLLHGYGEITSTCGQIIEKGIFDEGVLKSPNRLHTTNQGYRHSRSHDTLHSKKPLNTIEE